AVLLHARLERGVDGRVAIDERAVAIEDRQPLHRRFALPCDPRARRSPRRPWRRALAAAATLRDGPTVFGCSGGSASPTLASNPNVARLSAMCRGSSAVTSILPPSGASIRIRRA